MIIIVIRRNIDKVSGFPEIILGDICYKDIELNSISIAANFTFFCYVHRLINSTERKPTTRKSFGCLRVIVNETRINIENTTCSVLSVILINQWRNWLKISNDSTLIRCMLASQPVTSNF